LPGYSKPLIDKYNKNRTYITKLKKTIKIISYLKISKKQIRIFKIKYTTKICFPINNWGNCFSF